LRPLGEWGPIPLGGIPREENLGPHGVPNIIPGAIFFPPRKKRFFFCGGKQSFLVGRSQTHIISRGGREERYKTPRVFGEKKNIPFLGEKAGDL